MLLRSLPLLALAYSAVSAVSAASAVVAGNSIPESRHAQFPFPGEPQSHPVCYKHGHGDKCVNITEIKEYGQEWCKKYYNQATSEWCDYRDSQGRLGNIGKIGNFAKEEQCRVIFKDIVEWCNNNHGGVWTGGNGVSLNINFCDW